MSRRLSMIVRYLLPALALLTVAACTSSGLQATITDISDTAYDPFHPENNCGNTDILLLTVTDGGKQIVKQRECGYPLYNSAKAFKDRRGHIYVFRVTEASEGTGLQPQDVYVERVDLGRGKLYDVVKLPWSRPNPADMDATPWKTTYQVSDTEAGGLNATFTYPLLQPKERDWMLPENQVIVRLGSVSAGGSMPERAAPEAVVRPAPPETWCSQGHGRLMTEAVIDGGHTLAHQDECRSPDETLSAQTAVDRRGRIYMLLRARIADNRSPAVNDTLSVFELEAVPFRSASYPDPYAFTWMGDMVLSPWLDPAAQWQSTYHVRDTRGGGLEVIVDYSSVKSDGCCTPPERQVSLQLGP
jgi:hypothetical protein